MVVKSLFDLTGRVAIVTGGSRGLGTEFAEGLAEAGASLMLCARRDEWLVPGLEALRDRGFTADAMRCDVSNAADVQAVVDATVERFGKVDILLNNAGVSWTACRKRPCARGRMPTNIVPPLSRIIRTARDSGARTI